MGETVMNIAQFKVLLKALGVPTTSLTLGDVTTHVLDMNVVRYDVNNNLIDKNGAIISGVTSGTEAAMLALTPSSYTNTYFLVTDFGQDGLLYKSDGTTWRLNGRNQVVFLLPAPISYIAPAIQATAAADNGGNTQITAAAHLLTTSPAVGSKINISA